MDLNKLGQLGAGGGVSEYFQNLYELFNAAGPDVEFVVMVNHGPVRFTKEINMHSIMPERVDNDGTIFSPGLKYDNVRLIQTWANSGSPYNLARNLSDSYRSNSDIELNNLLFSTQGDINQIGAVIAHISRAILSTFLGKPLVAIYHHIAEDVDLEATKDNVGPKEEIGAWGLSQLIYYYLNKMIFLQPAYARTIAYFNPWFKGLLKKTGTVTHQLIGKTKIGEPVDYTALHDDEIIAFSFGKLGSYKFTEINYLAMTEFLQQREMLLADPGLVAKCTQEAQQKVAADQQAGKEKGKTQAEYFEGAVEARMLKVNFTGGDHPSPIFAGDKFSGEAMARYVMGLVGSNIIYTGYVADEDLKKFYKTGFQLLTGTHGTGRIGSVANFPEQAAVGLRSVPVFTAFTWAKACASFSWGTTNSCSAGKSPRCARTV